MFQAQYQSLKACSHRPGESYIPKEAHAAGLSGARHCDLHPCWQAAGWPEQGETGQGSYPLDVGSAAMQNYKIDIQLNLLVYSPFQSVYHDHAH